MWETTNNSFTAHKIQNGMNNSHDLRNKQSPTRDWRTIQLKCSRDESSDGSYVQGHGGSNSIEHSISRMSKFRKSSKGTKKERAIPIRKKTGRVEELLKEVSLKISLGIREGNRNPPLGGDVNPFLGGVINPLVKERRLTEVITSLDEKYKEKYNRLQQEI
jgi:hypothetical protein